MSRFVKTLSVALVAALPVFAASMADAKTKPAHHAHPAKAAPATPALQPVQTPQPVPVGGAIPAAPQVAARAAILVDYASGQVLGSQNPDARMEPASLTKLMTAYLVFGALKDGRLKLSDPITISEHAWKAEGSRSFVQVGTQVPAEILIKGMIVQSGNDASIALAEHLGGSEPTFAESMNNMALKLGMTNTHFEDATGLPSPTHYTTAHDMSLLARALIRDYPQYYGWFSMREFVWNNIKQQNRNGLLDKDSTVDGLKTGHTDSAGYCLVASAKRQNTRLISVVLGSDSFKGREDASAALLNYGFAYYETLPLKKAGELILKPRVYKGTENYVAVGVRDEVSISIPRGQAGQIQTRAEVTSPLIAPLDPATSVGELSVTLNGAVISRVPLYPQVAVPAAGFFGRLYDTIALWL
jgi:D-alanyl-D-alanine carboxypeptidase (penicillin-binding protein 5/6)